MRQDDAARQTLQSILSSVNPDLTAFKGHGGKMIQYAGWADAAIAPENGLNYYRAVTHTMGDPTDFYRVFMVPGMAHCGGGAGPNAFGNGTNNGPVLDADHDLVKALERWVEQGFAPDKIIATHYVNNAPALGVAFQRPLCPYPQRPEYAGQGDPSDAASFQCVAHMDPFRSSQHRPATRLQARQVAATPGRMQRSPRLVPSRPAALLRSRSAL